MTKGHDVPSPCDMAGLWCDRIAPGTHGLSIDFRRTWKARPLGEQSDPGHGSVSTQPLGLRLGAPQRRGILGDLPQAVGRD